MACSIVMTFAGRFGMMPSRMAISIDVASAGAVEGVSIVLFEMPYLWTDRRSTVKRGPDWGLGRSVIGPLGSWVSNSHLVAKVEKAERCAQDDA
jgi:hypothetical protein